MSQAPVKVIVRSAHVLRYRAMVHWVAAPGLAARPYFNRYTEDAVDLCDVLSVHQRHLSR